MPITHVTDEGAARVVLTVSGGFTIEDIADSRHSHSKEAP